MNEAERIKDTKNWPLYPKLPMKKPRPVGWPDLGFLMADEVEADGPITLYRGDGSESWEKFPSVEELVEAGWRGD